MTNNTSEKVVVFYHHPCLDGAASAWVAHEKWGDNAQYIGINHGDSDYIRDRIIQNIDADTHVVFADYTPPRKLMDEIVEACKDVAIYDHHATAINDMKGYSNKKVKAVFDSGRSGASITYNELFPRKRLPQAVELAEMIDLEQTHKGDYFTVAAYVDSLPIGSLNEAIQSFGQVNNMKLEDIIKQGKSIRRSNAIAIDKTIASAGWTKTQILPGTEPVYIPIINANPQLLGREYNIRLREMAESSAPGFTVLSWFEDKGVVRVSVRTNGVPDAGKVAEHIGKHGLGGGGHRDSAAAQFTIDEFNKAFHRKTQQQVVDDLANTEMVIDDPAGQKVGNKRSSSSRKKGRE